MTSAHSLDEYPAGKKIASSSGSAWRNVKVSVFELTAISETFTMPSVSEPFITWIAAGEAETQERDPDGPWLKNHIHTGSLFLTAAGASYEFSWKRLSAEPLVVVMVLLDLPTFEEALMDVHGEQAEHAVLRDLSGFEDQRLVGFLQCLRAEADLKEPSELYVRSVTQAICVHLARNYTDLNVASSKTAPSLPAFKLRRITEWMAKHFADEFSLAVLAEQAGLSEFHFNRLFKRAMGVPPSQHQIKLRMEAASRLLRETEMTVLTVANEVGYSNPSHFARIFRKATGSTPSEYRRQR
ncbi:helix-turn-helix domain-containing protein [Pseudomonas sp. RIT-To-2]|uniref:helix-turn-helix domain-containing protein n=1 Tax=Pseudomonas sp. RIT-To-2 TaxID=3462541 RepID=UPI0024135338